MQFDFEVAALVFAVFGIGFLGASIGNWISMRERKRMEVGFKDIVYKEPFKSKQTEVQCPTCKTWQYGVSLESDNFSIKIHVCENHQCRRILPLSVWED